MRNWKRPSGEMNLKEARRYYRNTDKNPITFAEGLKELLDKHRGPLELSRKSGIPVATIANYTSLLKLPQRIRTRIRHKTLSFKVGRAFVRQIDHPD